jgi:selenophosphate synthase
MNYIEAEKSGVLNQEENRKLKEQILTLNKQIERLERNSDVNSYEGKLEYS